MNNQSNFDTLKKDFIEYLSSLGVSTTSLKNYKSDVSHFLGWSILKVRSFGSYIESLSELLPFLSSNLIAEYKKYLVENATPDKTINRRLSTLRHLARFLNKTQIINSDFMDGIENISAAALIKIANHPLIDEFKSYLQAQKISHNTIKNYTSDIKQFMGWLEKNYQNFSSN